MTRDKAIQRGEDGAVAGSADFGQNGTGLDGVVIDASNAICNILHWVESQGADPDDALGKAGYHFEAERIGGDEELETEV